MGIEELRQEPMMEHLLDSLEQGKDIGHYGRLVVAMIARHFLDHDEVVEYLTKDKDFSAEQAELMIKQVEARGYNPPKRERILEWQQKQEFPICNSPEDNTQCNVYRNLDCPEEVYQKIAEYYGASDDG